MLDENQIEADLERMFNQSEPSIGSVTSAHPRVLEKQLLDAFDRKHGASPNVVPAKKKERRPMLKSNFLRRTILTVAACGVLGVVACAAPVDVDIDVGKSLSIHYAMTDGAPKPKEVADFLRNTLQNEALASKEKGSAMRDVGIHIMAGKGAVDIGAEIWGTDSHDAPLAPMVKKEFPALANADIKEEVLHGKVRSSFASKLGHDLLDLDLVDKSDVETAKQRVMEQLKAKGIDGKVDVKVDDADGERKVIIKVEKEVEDGQEPAQ